MKLPCTLLTGSIALFFPATLSAVTKTHNGTGSLSGGTKWSPAGTPTTTDEALITGTPNAAITTALGTNLTFGDFIFNSNVACTLGPNSTGTTNTNWTLSGGGSTVVDGTNGLTKTGAGTLIAAPFGSAFTTGLATRRSAAEPIRSALPAMDSPSRSFRKSTSTATPARRRSRSPQASHRMPSSARSAKWCPCRSHRACAWRWACLASLDGASAVRK